MVLLHTPEVQIGSKIPSFKLVGTDDKVWKLDDFTDKSALLVMFICNHCPYVKAIQQRLVSDMKLLQAQNIGVVAISANDPNEYPEDDMTHMKKISQEWGYTFPYLFDETQEVAKSFGAVCTPDFFGYNAKGELQYRGRLDAFSRDLRPEKAKAELVEAMQLISKSGKGPSKQFSSMGCSIKWRNED
jgi:peroxiredoxin